MAQMCYKDIDTREREEAKNENREERRSNGSFKFNVAAPEFVPTVAHKQAHHDEAQMPITGYFYPCFQYVDGTTSGSWIYVAGDQEITLPLVQTKANGASGVAQSAQHQAHQAKEITISDALRQKIIKQAEYMFSDMSMLANETLVKHVSKDPEGFVPINFVATLKKLKSLNVTNQMVAQALQSSSKLVVSNDGKKVRRKLPFTEKEREELQLRTVIAENLPDDHSHQKMEKMFNVVGSIKSIRICQPQEPNSSRSSKGDLVISNKLHALIEYENPETAEKAAEKLNDERNWRKGMRVRLMLKRSKCNVQPKSVLKTRKSDFDAHLDDEGSAHKLHEDTSRTSTPDTSDADDSPGASKRSWLKNRGKPKHRPLQTARSLPTPLTGSCPGEVSSRQAVKGPRMPDGTRGFTMGRGKPLRVQV